MPLHVLLILTRLSPGFLRALFFVNPFLFYGNFFPPVGVPTLEQFPPSAAQTPPFFFPSIPAFAFFFRHFTIVLRKREVNFVFRFTSYRPQIRRYCAGGCRSLFPPSRFFSNFSPSRIIIAELRPSVTSTIHYKKQPAALIPLRGPIAIIETVFPGSFKVPAPSPPSMAGPSARELVFFFSMSPTHSFGFDRQRFSFPLWLTDPPKIHFLSTLTIWNLPFKQLPPFRLPPHLPSSRRDFPHYLSHKTLGSVSSRTLSLELSQSLFSFLRVTPFFPH